MQRGDAGESTEATGEKDKETNTETITKQKGDKGTHGEALMAREQRVVFDERKGTTQLVLVRFGNELKVVVVCEVKNHK